MVYPFGYLERRMFLLTSHSRPQIPSLPYLNHLMLIEMKLLRSDIFKRKRCKHSSINTQVNREANSS